MIEQRLPRWKQTRHRVHLRDLDILLTTERWQDRRDAFRDHGLPGAGDTGQEQIVATRGRDESCTDTVALSMDLGEVHSIGFVNFGVHRFLAWVTEKAFL